MQRTYDPRYNVAYIRLREKTAEVETLPIGGELNLAPDGTVYGIELLNANPQLSSAERASPANDHRPASPSISLKTNVRW